MLLLDVLPLSLVSKHMGNLLKKLFLETLQFLHLQKTFTTFKDGQTKLLIHVLQGERICS